MQRLFPHKHTSFLSFLLAAWDVDIESGGTAAMLQSCNKIHEDEGLILQQRSVLDGFPESPALAAHPILVT